MDEGHRCMFNVSERELKCTEGYCTVMYRTTFFEVGALHKGHITVISLNTELTK